MWDTRTQIILCFEYYASQFENETLVLTYQNMKIPPFFEGNFQKKNPYAQKQTNTFNCVEKQTFFSNIIR